MKITFSKQTYKVKASEIKVGECFIYEDEVFFKN